MNLEGHPRPAGMALPRQRLGAEGQACDRDHRHQLDPPAEDLHQRRELHREGADVADDHPLHLPALGDRHRLHRPARSARTECRRTSTASARRGPDHDHDHRSATPTSSKRRRRAAVHQLLPPGRLHRAPGARLRARAEPGGEGRDRADPDQLEDVRRRPPADLPGHRHRQRVPEDRHGRALRGLSRQRRGRRQRRRAQGLPRPRQHAARVDRRRPALRAQEHQGQHAGGGPHDARARQHGRRDRRRQGRRQREQEQVRDDEPERQPGRLGAEDGADDGRRLVPAGHARHRHRRHRREGDADGQAEPDGRHRHARAEAARPAEQDRGSCASSCSTRSTRSASARRAWAA